MKKLISIFFFLALIIPFAGTYTWFQLKKQLLKKEVKRKIIAGIEKEDLVLLKFTLDESNTILSWKHPGEFSYKGEMYDIVEKVTVHDSIFYYCWSDHEETMLNKKLNALLAGASEKKQEHNKKFLRIYHFLLTLYIPESSVDTDEYLTPLKSLKFYYFQYFNPVNLSPPAPPPWFTT
ncbi:MAG TPA: hypothetical protein PK915_07530 [Bacteroidales bacterium]|nr:hypothetical protein [Bacteroidales bacterium]